MTSKKGRRKDIDGGWAWVVAAAHFMWFFVSVGFHKSFGLIFLQLILRLNVSTFQISWIMFIGSFISSAAGIAGGFFSDKYSMRLVMVIVAALGAGGVVILAYSSNLAMVMVGRSIFTSFSGGLVTSCLIGENSKYFRRKRPLASTLSFSGSSLGGLVMPILIAYLLQRVGYTQTVVIVAGFWLHGCLAGVVLRPAPVFTDKVPAAEVLSETKEDIVDDAACEKGGTSVEADNTDDETAETPFSVEFEGGEKEGATAQKSSNEGRLGRYSFFKNLQVVRYLLCVVLGSMAYYNWFLFFPLFTSQAGLSTTQTSLCISVSSVTDGVMRPVVGAILSKRNNPPDKPLVTCLCCFLASICTLAVSFTADFWFCLLYGVLFGFVSGIFISLSVPMMADHTPLQQMGSLSGIFTMSIASGLGIGSPIIGAVVDLSGWQGYAMIMISGIYMCTSLIYGFNFVNVKRGKIKFVT